MLSIFLTNLGKYNEGYLIGEWVTLPVDDDKLEAVKKRIGINERYEEWFITDYETNIDGMKIDEYSNINELNEIAEMLEELNETDKEIIEVLIFEGYSINEALEKKDDVMVFYNCYDMEDVAIRHCEECGILNETPEHLRYYFDYEALGRDMFIEGNFIFAKNGICVAII